MRDCVRSYRARMSLRNASSVERRCACCNSMLCTPYVSAYICPRSSTSSVPFVFCGSFSIGVKSSDMIAMRASFSGEAVRADCMGAPTISRYVQLRQVRQVLSGPRNEAKFGECQFLPGTRQYRSYLSHPTAPVQVEALVYP